LSLPFQEKNGQKIGTKFKLNEDKNFVVGCDTKLASVCPWARSLHSYLLFGLNFAQDWWYTIMILDQLSIYTSMKHSLI
jgi:hypothetical protein